MANEFIVKNGLIIQGGTTTITGSLTVSGSITGSGVISGSITNAVSASYAITSSFSSFSQTSSLATNANNIFVKVTGSAGVHYIHFGLSTLGYDAVLVDNGITYEPDKNQLNTGTVVATNFVGTASLASTSSFLSPGTYNITASQAQSSSFATTASYAESALTASYTNNFTTADDTQIIFNSGSYLTGSSLTYNYNNNLLTTTHINIIGRIELTGYSNPPVNSSPYTVDDTTTVVVIDTNSGAVDIDLSSNCKQLGRIITIKDIGGNANVNNITFSADVIDGVTGGYTLTRAFGSVTLMYYDPSSTFIVLSEYSP